MTDFKIPYGRQNIDESDIKGVVDTLQSDFLTQGPKVQEFEMDFAQYVGSKYAVAVSNATCGLHIAALALGVEKGDRVITTPITFAASANCVKYCGGEVWFADIDSETFLLDPDSVVELIESKPKGFFKGIIAVDFAGLPIDSEKFKEIADAHDLWLIEDACHAPGSAFTDSKGDSIKTGSSIYSDISIFSFHPVKHIACGEGGMVTTNSEKVYKKLMSLRTHGITKENMSENHGGWFYEMQELGYNYRLTDFQASLGITQLKKNDWSVSRRNEIAQSYQSAFERKIKFQFNPEGFLNAYHLFVIQVENRLELYNHLREKGIFAQIHYIPVHKLPYYQQISKDYGNLENAENYYDSCISLPMFPTLTGEEVQYVIDCVLNFEKA